MKLGLELSPIAREKVVQNCTISRLVTREVHPSYYSCTQDHIGEQFRHHLDVPITFVVDESLLSEFIHEKDDFRRRSPDDFGQLLVSDATRRAIATPIDPEPNSP